MGWSFGYNQTKESLVQELTQSGTGSYPENKMLTWNCLAHSLRGNSLWSVWERLNSESGESIRYIRLDLLSYASQHGGYGYKSMSEACGPYYYNCPLKFLEMAPVANQEWRDKVIANHAKLKTIKATASKVRIGDIMELLPTCSIKAVKIERQIKKSFIGSDKSGKSWKVTPRYFTGNVLTSF